MSFILDALKKSENERQEQSAAEFASVPSGEAASRAPRWLWILLLLLAVNAVVLLGLVLRDDTQAVITQVVEEPAPRDVAAPQPVESQPEPTFADQIEEARERQPVARAEPASRSEAQPEARIESTPEARSDAPATTSEPAYTLRALPTAAELRANGTLQMAELHLDIHVFSDAPEDRFVFINMVRHKEDSRLAEGPVVKEITPEGVILDYLGTEFLLPRE